MTAFKGLGTYGDAVGVVTPLDHKLAQAAQVTKTTTPLVIRPGLFYSGATTIVSGTAGMSYSVAAYQLVTQRSAGAGVVFGGNDGTLSVATTAAPGSNSRIDVVYHWHREFALDGVNSNPVLGVVQGTAAAIPTVPSLASFPGAIELARVTVNAAATATNGAGVTITQVAPFTTVDGARVPFRNKTAIDLWTTAATHQLALAVDTGLEYKWSGSVWALTFFDTGWITPTLLNSWGVSGGLTPQYRVKDGVLYARGQATGGAANSVIYQIADASYRPVGQTFKTITPNTDGTAFYRLQVTTGGDVSVSNAGSSATPVVQFTMVVGS
jgi:hypothetical protein